MVLEQGEGVREMLNTLSGVITGCLIVYGFWWFFTRASCADEKHVYDRWVQRRETYITASAPLAPPVNEREPTPGSTEYDAPQEPVPELVAPQAQVDAWVKQEPGLERVRAMLVTMWRRGDDVSLDTPGHRDMWNLCRAAERGGE